MISARVLLVRYYTRFLECTTAPDVKCFNRQAYKRNSIHMFLAWMCQVVSDPKCSRLKSRLDVKIPTSDATITCVVVFEKMMSSLECRDKPLTVAVGFSSGHLQIYSVGKPFPETDSAGVWPQLSKPPRTNEKTVSLVLATRAHDAAVSKIMVDICIVTDCNMNGIPVNHTRSLSFFVCACAPDIPHRPRAAACVVSA